jgi:phage-related protein
VPGAHVFLELRGAALVGVRHGEGLGRGAAEGDLVGDVGPDLGLVGVPGLRADHGLGDLRHLARPWLASIFLFRYNQAMHEGAPASPKRLEWIGSSKKDLKELPETVVQVFGYALYLAQIGQKHEQAKPLRGFGSAGILEVVEDWRGNTYRAVYTVRYAVRVFVLHVFQKKSKSGVATPKADVELIRIRLKAADRRAKELEDE